METMILPQMWFPSRVYISLQYILPDGKVKQVKCFVFLLLIPTARIERAQKFLMMITPRLARSQSENVDVGRNDGMVWEFPIALHRRYNVALPSQLLTPLGRRWRTTSRRDKGQTKCCDGRIVVELCCIVIDASRIGGILWAGKVRAGAPRGEVCPG